MKKIDNPTNRMVTKIVSVVASLSSLAILNSTNQYTQPVLVVNCNGTWLGLTVRWYRAKAIAIEARAPLPSRVTSIDSLFVRFPL